MRFFTSRRSGTAIGLALSLSLTLAPVTQAQGADVYGVGGGWTGVDADAKLVEFAFSGHTRPQGDFGSFKWEQQDGALVVRADLDCVNAFTAGAGGGAWLQGVVKHVEPAPNTLGITEGERVAWYVEDNGEPPDLPPDEIFGPIQNIPPNWCKTQFVGKGVPITNGNINVKFESLLP